MRKIYFILTVLTFFTAPLFSSSEVIKRYAIVAGCNYGGDGVEDLQYSLEDAKNFKDVLTSLGGTDAKDVTLLNNPDVDDLRKSIVDLNRVLKEDTDNKSRTEVLFFYSGHSDKKGLKLYDKNYSYRELKRDIDSLKSDVKIVVLDSCYSGEFTRFKGGVRKSPFIFDVSNETEGKAVLTSSTGDEQSQESDLYGSSFFSHALITGLRGAADSNSDKKVTLNEAYQFAFDETLRKTESKGEIAQHPAYNIDLIGTGNLILTDLEAQTSKLVLKEELSGTVAIRDKNGKLIAEIKKVKGDEIEFCIDSGSYSFLLTDGDKKYSGNFKLGVNDTVTSDSFKLKKRSFIPGLFKGEDSKGGFYPVGYNFSGDKDSNIGGISLFGAEYESFSIFNLGLLYTKSSGESSYYQGAFIANLSKGPYRGVQFSGILNSSKNQLYGLQLSAINLSEELKGVQAGVINSSSDFTGLQIGIINKAKKGKGVQVGLINISDELSGVPIGLIDIQKNGENYFNTWYEGNRDNSFVYSGFRFGSRYLYKQLSLGSGKVGNNNFYKGSLCLDLGFRIPLFNNRLSILNDAGVDFISKRDLDNYEVYNSVIPRVNNKIEIKLSNRIGIIAGVSTRFYIDSFNDNMTDSDAYEYVSPFGECILSHRAIFGIEFR